jgi:hypothetical protein
MSEESEGINVRVGWGKYTFSTLSGRLSCMVVEPAFKQSLAGATSAPGVIRRLGTPLTTIASDYPELHGSLQTVNILSREGTVFCARFSKSTNKLPAADAAVFVRVRESGPTVKIKARIPAHRDSHLPETFHVFTGKGDVLSYNQLIGVGIAVPKQFRFSYMDEEEIEECFDVVVMDDGSPANFTVKAERRVNARGEEKVIVVSEARRRVRIRRP